MTFWMFAAEHSALAVTFAVLALCAVVAPVALVIWYLRDRMPEMGPEDRTALAKAAARLRMAAMRFGGDEHYASRDAARAEAEALERLASR